MGQFGYGRSRTRLWQLLKKIKIMVRRSKTSEESKSNMERKLPGQLLILVLHLYHILTVLYVGIKESSYMYSRLEHRVQRS